MINYNSWESNQVSYTFTGGNGFSAIVAAEQGSVNDDFPDYVIDSYMPHVMAGVKLEQGWGKISGIVGYDSNVEAFAAKARLDVNITDKVSAWVMGAYQSDYDETRVDRRHGRVIGRLGAVSLPRLPTRQPSMPRPPTNPKAHTLWL